MSSVPPLSVVQLHPPGFCFDFPSLRTVHCKMKSTLPPTPKLLLVIMALSQQYKEVVTVPLSPGLVHLSLPSPVSLRVCEASPLASSTPVARS